MICTRSGRFGSATVEAVASATVEAVASAVDGATSEVVGSSASGVDSPGPDAVDTGDDVSNVVTAGGMAKGASSTR